MTTATYSTPPDHNMHEGPNVNVSAVFPAKHECACATCPLGELNVCGTANKTIRACANAQSGHHFQMPTEHTVPARHIVWHPKDWSDYVPVICRGWAVSSITLSNGNRQILSFHLPGDIVSTATLFGAVSRRRVEAITEVTFRKFRRTDLEFMLGSDPDFYRRVSKAWVREREYADSLLVDLGRRMADARVSRLILHLAESATRRNMMDGATMPFPVRQRHIADATGLTTNHVTKTLAIFSRSGLIKFASRFLTIINVQELQRIADWEGQPA